MIQSFLAGGIWRFLIRFVPHAFNTLSDYFTQQQSIEQQRLRLELAKLESQTQTNLEEIKANAYVSNTRIIAQANEAPPR